MAKGRDDLLVLDGAPLGDDRIYYCDLCYRRMENESAYSIIELRAVCLDCQQRFTDTRDDLRAGRKVNFEIGLVERGYFAGPTTIPPPDNGLGGRQ